MRRLLSGKLRQVSGQGLVELCGALLFLVPLTLGLVDLSRAIHAHNAIVNMSREGANLASRSGLMDQSQGAQMIMNAVAGTAQDLDMKGKGMMYLTQVQGKGGMPNIKGQPIAWAQNPGGPPSAINNGTLPGVLGQINVGVNDTVWIFEVFYQYTSMFVPGQGYQPQLHAVAIFAGGLK
jgi:hypothetical protein